MPTPLGAEAAPSDSPTSDASQQLPPGADQRPPPEADLQQPSEADESPAPEGAGVTRAATGEELAHIREMVARKAAQQQPSTATEPGTAEPSPRTRPANTEPVPPEKSTPEPEPFEFSTPSTDAGPDLPVAGTDGWAPPARLSGSGFRPENGQAGRNSITLSRIQLIIGGIVLVAVVIGGMFIFSNGDDGEPTDEPTIESTAP